MSTLVNKSIKVYKDSKGSFLSQIISVTSSLLHTTNVRLSPSFDESHIDEAKAELNGVTLESLVVAERVARAIKAAAKSGALNPSDFPILMHVDDILTKKAEVNIPWESFTFECEK